MGNWLDDVKPEYRPQAQLGADLMALMPRARNLALEGNGEVYDIVWDLCVAANELVLLLSDKHVEPAHQHYVLSAEDKARRALARIEALNKSIAEVPNA